MTKKKQKYTVLLLSAPIGSGHRLAAEALREAFAEHEEVEVVHGNVFDFFPHFLGTAFLRSYLWILGCCPWLYELAYKWGNSHFIVYQGFVILSEKFQLLFDLWERRGILSDEEL